MPSSGKMPECICERGTNTFDLGCPAHGPFFEELRRRVRQQFICDNSIAEVLNKEEETK